MPIHLILICSIGFVVASAASHPASAQSVDTLHATTAAAAQQYGIPVDVLNQVIQGESSFNPNVGCNSYGACGVAQFIPGTAARYGVDVNDPTSSINGAAQYLSDLHDQTGSYVGALTKYTGGCTPLRPCNPAYAQAFQNAQTADSGGTTFTDGTTLTANTNGTAAPPVPSTAPLLGRPFQWAWDHIMIQAQDHVGTAIGQVQNIAWMPIVPIIAIWGIVSGTLFWAGRLYWGDLVAGLVTLAIVTGLVIPGSNWYSQWVQFAEGLPGYFAANTGGMLNSGPAGVFDSVWQAFWIKMVSVWQSSPWEKILLTALLLFFVIADIAGALGTLFFTFLLANFVLYILLAVGAVFILGLLFTGTRGFFRFWLDLLVAVLAYILILDVMLGFFVTVLNQLVDAVNVGVGTTGTAWTNILPNLLGAVIVFNVLAGVNAFLALQFGRIHGYASSGISGGAAGMVQGIRFAARYL